MAITQQVISGKMNADKTMTEQWLQARTAKARDGTDELARHRQELPRVPINKGYRFETDERSASLPDLFRSPSQLLVYHFMFGPVFKAGRPRHDGYDKPQESGGKRSCVMTGQCCTVGRRPIALPGNSLASTLLAAYWGWRKQKPGEWLGALACAGGYQRKRRVPALARTN